MEKSNVEEREFTAEETKNQMMAHEDDILQGMLAAAEFQSNETQTIEIARNGKVYFKFRIRPLSEAEYEKCKKKHTKYVRNKQLGIKMPEDTNGVKYRSELIYEATVAEDRNKMWDNKKLWSALSEKGTDILTGTDVIDAVLMSGEKAAIVDKIDSLSGYNESNLEEVAKN